jgi:pimeloyl-ACP methyl ester carboxylesterase
MGKSTFIFVHGAWHPAACWDKVIAELEPQGYKCIAPQMLFCGTPEPIDKIQVCIDQLAEIIKAETSAGNDVVMVGHSFGGVSSSSAIKGFTAADASKLASNGSGKVIGIALMCAMICPTNSSFGKTYAHGEPKHDIIAAPTPDGWADLIGQPQALFYQDLPAEEADKWAGELKRQSFKPFIDDEGVYAGWLDVPLWYLQCEKDAILSSAFQGRMINLAKDSGSKVEVRKTDAGHSPSLSRVEDSVKFLVDAAGSMSR